MQPSETIWMNGEFVPWDEAQVHVLTHALHYGTSVFEGVRCYDTEIGPAVFRHRDHVERLFASAGLYYMPVPFEREEIRRATLETIARNNLRSCYIRPLVFRGYGTMGLFPLEAKVDVIIATWEWGAYLGEEGKANGIRAKVSSWRRISPESLIPHAKAGGQYLNSVLAKIETHKAGYDEAILLDDHGHVCEGSGENIFVVRDGVIFTPPPTASIWPTNCRCCRTGCRLSRPNARARPSNPRSVSRSTRCFRNFPTPWPPPRSRRSIMRAGSTTGARSRSRCCVRGSRAHSAAISTPSISPPA